MQDTCNATHKSLNKFFYQEKKKPQIAATLKLLKENVVTISMQFECRLK